MYLSAEKGTIMVSEKTKSGISNMNAANGEKF
jgi:hypothetical protein